MDSTAHSEPIGCPSGLYRLNPRAKSETTLNGAHMNQNILQKGTPKSYGTKFENSFFAARLQVVKIVENNQEPSTNYQLTS